MSEIQVQVIQPYSHPRKSRAFKVTIDSVEWIAKVTLVGQQNVANYRIRLFTPEGVLVKSTCHLKWKQVRKEILLKLMESRTYTGMSLRVARL